MKPIDVLLSRLDKVRQTGNRKWQSRCPAHEDKSPSLSITEKDDGRILIHCHAQCGGAAVTEAVGLSLSDLFPERRGEFMSKPHRSSDNRPAKPAYESMQEEIYRLRARLSAQ